VCVCLYASPRTRAVEDKNNDDWSRHDTESESLSHRRSVAATFVTLRAGNHSFEERALHALFSDPRAMRAMGERGGNNNNIVIPKSLLGARVKRARVENAKTPYT